MKLLGHSSFLTLRGKRYQSSDQNNLFIEVGNIVRGKKEKEPWPRNLSLRDFVEGQNLVRQIRHRRLDPATAVVNPSR
jgi:hypothetical protein